LLFVGSFVERVAHVTFGVEKCKQSIPPFHSDLTFLSNYFYPTDRYQQG